MSGHGVTNVCYSGVHTHSHNHTIHMRLNKSYILNTRCLSWCFQAPWSSFDGIIIDDLWYLIMYFLKHLIL